MKRRVAVACLGAFALVAGGTPAAWAQAALSEAERAELERALDQAKEEIRAASEEIARLSMELAEDSGHGWFRQLRVGSDRPVLGVLLEKATRGVGIMSVTPDGPADEAGIRGGDRLVALDDVSLSDLGGNEAIARVVEFMKQVEEGQAVDVRVERDGSERDFVVTCQALPDSGGFSFSYSGDIDLDADELEQHLSRGLEEIESHFGKDGAFAYVFDTARGPWADLEVVELTPGLGDYFGSSEGLLVVRAPADAAVDLRDGDVIVAIDGREVTRTRELLGRLRDARPGQALSLRIVRQRRSVTVEARVPARED